MSKTTSKKRTIFWNPKPGDSAVECDAILKGPLKESAMKPERRFCIVNERDAVIDEHLTEKGALYLLQRIYPRFSLGHTLTETTLLFNDPNYYFHIQIDPDYEGTPQGGEGL